MLFLSLLFFVCFPVCLNALQSIVCQNQSQWRMGRRQNALLIVGKRGQWWCWWWILWSWITMMIMAYRHIPTMTDSHHGGFFVRDDNGGNLSGDKIPPLMMIIINHLTQFNSSRSLVMLLPDWINTALNNHRQKTISHLLKFWYCTHYNNWYERKWDKRQ